MNNTVARKMEAPVRKAARDENFPVGSLLLSRSLRPHVASFYNLAREMDDIADNGNISWEDKLAQLDRFEKALADDQTEDQDLGTARAMAASSAKTGVSLRHVVDLIHAFKQDAVKHRYADWEDLIAYCNLSASPVGRFLMDIHGEETAKYPLSDALCNVLQVLNHLQDLKDDYRKLDRVYLPGDWMAMRGVCVEELNGQSAGPGLRAVIDLCLDNCDRLMIDARRLSSELANRRLRMEASVIVRLAERLLDLLRKGDPIAESVALTKRDFLLCGLRGIVAALLKR